MDTFFYSIFLRLYVAGVKILSCWNSKAGLWIAGRKKFPDITYSRNNNTQTVWIHCASLGEFEQGRPVIELLKKQNPDLKVVLTFFSPSGYEVQKSYSGADAVFYLPIDSKTNADKMISIIQPSLVLWVKYEYWFFYLQAFKQHNIPVLLVSGIFRKSQPFFKWYGGMWKKILPSFAHFFVQDKASEKLLADVGLNKNVTVSGDTRFDRVIEIAARFTHIPMIQSFCGNSKVVVAGSTWDEDEAELIHYVKANPQIKFIVAPHEIDGDNLKDVQKQFSGSIYYSELKDDTEISTNVLIIDNVGMLSRLYYYADITYVGGGFGGDGVHNVLEAAVYGKPVIYGPEFEKFIEAVELTNCGGGISISSALELEAELNKLWEDEILFRTTGDAAKAYVYSNAGASKKIADFIQAKRLLIN
ncbi:glycosyltransferase N-terminal domain-containing protein [soil metagenome]